MYLEEKTIKAYHIIVMLISPIFGLVLLLKSKTKKHITFMGTLFFGMIGSLFIYIGNSDGDAHLELVKRFYLDMSFWEFLTDAFRLLTFQPTSTTHDLFKHVIAYLAGVFQIPELIHVFGGLLLGYFFTKSVLLVIEVVPKHKKSTLLLGFIVLFLIVRSISALNSLRMWVAMWVFFYGALAYVKKKERKYLWTIGLAILIHFSYLLFVIPLIAAIALRKRKMIVLGIFASSFFINVGFEQATKFVGSAELYEDKIKSNVIDDREKDRRASKVESSTSVQNFYKEFGPYVYNTYSILLLSFILILIYLKNKNLDYVDFLIASGFLLIALSNLAENTSPSVNGRGFTLAATFLNAAAIQVIALNLISSFSKTKRDLINMGLLIFILSAIPHMIFHLSYAINSVSMFSVGFPVSSWVLGDDDLSIKQFIKQFIF